MAETTTIYVTKGAETKGIRKVEAVPTGYGYWKDPTCFDHFSPSQVHHTIEEAAGDAERRRTKRIASLKRKIAAMEALDLSSVKEG